LPKKQNDKRENKTINDKRAKANQDNVTRGSVRWEVGAAKEDRIGERDTTLVWNKRKYQRQKVTRQ
jgi:hypothetical protein